MSNIIDVLKSQKDFYCKDGVSQAEIAQAEQVLGLNFAPEYREYLVAFGVVSANGHEYTGLGLSARLDVIAVTTLEREQNPNIPGDFYVIEQANIDRIVIWQSSDGEIYQTIGTSQPTKICDSLCEYIAM